MPWLYIMIIYISKKFTYQYQDCWCCCREGPHFHWPNLQPVQPNGKLNRSRSKSNEFFSSDVSDDRQALISDTEDNVTVSCCYVQKYILYTRFTLQLQVRLHCSCLAIGSLSFHIPSPSVQLVNPIVMLAAVGENLIS